MGDLTCPFKAVRTLKTLLETQYRTVFTHLKLFAFVMELEKIERPHFYDNFILANYLLPDNRSTTILF